jgi:hypothetical protein
MCLEGVKKTMKNLSWKVGILAKILTGHLLNTSQRHYHMSQLA